VKELNFASTDDGDYAIKLRNIIRFIEDGIKRKSLYASEAERLHTKSLVWRYLDV